MAKHVDDEHMLGQTITNGSLRAAILHEFGVAMCRMTMSNYLRQLGLSWNMVRARKRTFYQYRSDAIRSYIIQLSAYRKREREEKDIVMVYMDESYIHQTHSHSMSYLKATSEVNRGAGRGRRLVILHAITKDGPLCETDKAGIPVDDLKWSGDTPHPEPRADGKLTCELLWLANSSTGDYHDNMNSNMFMKWVQEKLVPTFDRLHPGKKMLLICDNAPYHHKREIGSLSGLSKAKLLDLCVKHEFEYLDLECTTSRVDAFDEDLVTNVEDRGSVFRVDFNVELFRQMSSKSKPWAPSAKELPIAIMEYMRENLPDLLECKVESYMKERGHFILWTPPYCPDLQPIELFGE